MTTLDKHIMDLRMIKALTEDPEEHIAALIIKGLFPAEHEDALFMEMREQGRIINLQRELTKQNPQYSQYCKPYTSETYEKPEIKKE